MPHPVPMTTEQPLKAILGQYWVIAGGIGLAGLAVAIVAVVLAGYPCPRAPNFRYGCHKQLVDNLLGLWHLAMILLGPIPAFRHQHRKVKSRERSTWLAVLHCGLSAAVSGVVAVFVVYAVVFVDQRFMLFGLFSGDAGIGFVLVGVYPFLTTFGWAIAAAIVFSRSLRAADSRALLQWEHTVMSSNPEAFAPCPFCGEPVRASTAVCRWCKRVLRTSTTPDGGRLQ